MATKLNGFKTQRKFTGSKKLPVGGYVLKIMNTKDVTDENGRTRYIEVSFDVAEGDLAGFFADNYKNNTNEDKRWKGKAKIWYPKDDDDSKGLASLSDIIACFEDSNKNYHWDWDEKKLVGKLVGGIFRTTHTMIDGKQISYTEFAWFTDADSIRNNNFTIPNDYYKNGASASGGNTNTSSFTDIPSGEEEGLPFNW